MHPIATPLSQPIAPLHALLDASLHLPPEYRDQLTNHLPMALHALHSLGASPQRMQAFYASYARRFQSPLAPLPTPALDDAPQDWQALRGQPDAYPTLLAHFKTQVARAGVDATLRGALPALMPGVSAAAFHGAIRTAHAVQAGHDQELAAALAYWAWRWQTLPPPSPTACGSLPPEGAAFGLGAARRQTLPPPSPTACGSLHFAAWAERLVQDSIGWRSEGPSISIRMLDASQSPVYRALAGALPPAASVSARIAELAALAVQRYVASPNFTVLHMVTGLRALRTLLPWLEDSAALQATLVHNVVAAYLAAHAVPLAAPPTVPPCGWPEAMAAAIASDDDHVIKLVHACQEEAAVYGEDHYLHAAALVTRAR